MKLISNLIFAIILFFLLFVLRISNITAAETPSVTPQNVDENTPSVTITFPGLTNGTEFTICSKHNTQGQWDICEGNKVTTSASSNRVTITACATSSSELKFAPNCGDGDYFHSDEDNANEYKAYLFRRFSDHDELISTAAFNVAHVFPNPPTFSTQSPTPDDQITITLTGQLKRPLDPSDGDHCRENEYEVIIKKASGDPVHNQKVTLSQDCSGNYQSTTFPALLADSYMLQIDNPQADFAYYTVDFTVEVGGGQVEDPVRGSDDGSGGPPTQGRNPCAGGVCKTALGNLSTDIGAFSSQFLSIAIGLAGGIALVIMVIGSVRVLMSSGDPKNVGAGRDMIIAAVAGLLFLIFSVLILQFIGVKILGGII